MANLKKYTRAEALEICRRMGLAEAPLSNDSVLIGTNDKGHIYKFPIKTKEDFEAEAASKQTKTEEVKEQPAEKPVEKPVVEEVKEEVTPPAPVKRKRGRPPKKKKAE